MSPNFPTPQVLIGPRKLDQRICRLMYVRETDEMWAEEWSEREWVRTSVLARHLLNAPAPSRAVLTRRGVPHEPGAWDREPAKA